MEYKTVVKQSKTKTDFTNNLYPICEYEHTHTQRLERKYAPYTFQILKHKHEFITEWTFLKQIKSIEILNAKIVVVVGVALVSVVIIFAL